MSKLKAFTIKGVNFHISPYGRASSALKEIVEQDPPYADWLRAALNRRFSRQDGSIAQFWITSAQDLDASFVKLFRARSSPASRLLVMNPLGQNHSTATF